MQPRQHHEIPNPSIVDAARQFHNGFRSLINRPFEGLLLPALQCASLALELYLKSLSAREIEVPAPSGGDYIYARWPANSHDLGHLFDKAARNVQDLIEDAFSRMPGSIRFPGVREALVYQNALLFASRYPFEPGMELENTKI